MEDKKKKTLAIVLGIFALVIVTTVASFAFFTYSRTGTTTSTIISGDIEFSFIEGTSATLANAFPVADSVGAVDTSGEYLFDVKLTSSSNSNKMNYNVLLVDNNDETGVNYFNNEQIKFSLVKNNTYVANTSSTSGVKLSDIDGFDELSNQGEGIVLQDQEITAGTTDNYKLRIWISDDVNYSNTENGQDEQESIGKYNSYQYSLKVKVTSGLGSTTNASGINIDMRTVTVDLEDNNGLSHYAVTKSNNQPSSNEWIEITNETAKSNVVRTAGELIKNKQIKFTTEDYGTYYLHIKNLSNQIKTTKIEVKPKEIVKDTSGAAVPNIKGDLVAVYLNGSDVIKADTSKGWYNYDQSIWANAVILTDDAPTYNNGEMIKEEHIESYFVWIPRYEYKIFDEQAGNYTTFADKGSKKQEIEIRFVDKTDAVQNGSTYGTWLTHPAFTSFDSNGMWVGKFESGYKGATTTTDAQKNENDSSKLIIKPNVYSWRNIQVANAYQTSYNYNRTLDSHMMKNTEWGAVAYLSHSKYGSKDAGDNIEVRINNNNEYITGYSAIEEPTIADSSYGSVEGNRNEYTALGKDGQYTVNYLNNKSNKSSTTGNYSGIYDMSGGAWEYVMGVVLDSEGNPLSGRHNVLNSNFNGKYGCPTCDSTTTGVDSNILENTIGVDFPTDTRYYDSYSYSSVWNKYNTRILGDATGEMGPFYQEQDQDGATKFKSSWYEDRNGFVHYSYPFVMRGGLWKNGTGAGLFAFYYTGGNNYGYIGFRVVLTP